MVFRFRDDVVGVMMEKRQGKEGRKEDGSFDVVVHL